MSDETFSRVVGQRPRPVPGALPSREARDAMTRMAAYRTSAPKGIFRYKTHEEANRQRDAWTVERALTCAEDRGAGRTK